jgi:hypothetical protein
VADVPVGTRQLEVPIAVEVGLGKGGSDEEEGDEQEAEGQEEGLVGHRVFNLVYSVMRILDGGQQRHVELERVVKQTGLGEKVPHRLKPH